MADGIQIQQNDVQVEGDSATLTSQALAQAFEEDRQAVTDFLSSEAAPVQADDISVDESGRVVVRNSAFAKAVEPTREPEGEGYNLLCGYGC